jgi:1,4-dihydroxy-2-naphthoyl-CoA hydrolase
MTPAQINATLFPFARLLGITVTRADSDVVEAEMTVREELCTSGEILHGGAIMAFADSLGAIVTVVNLPADAKGTATIESKTNFLRAAPIGAKLVGRAIPLHRGKTTHVLQTAIENEAGKPIAVITQTQMVLR